MTKVSVEMIMCSVMSVGTNAVVLHFLFFFFSTVHCSAYYLQSCGANRRTAGVVTDIDRPDNHVCGASRSRWKGRANVKGETHAATRKEMLEDVAYHVSK